MGIIGSEEFYSIAEPLLSLMLEELRARLGKWNAGEQKLVRNV
jgi:hypothetical protein